jgi:polyferredoxin
MRFTRTIVQVTAALAANSAFLLGQTSLKNIYQGKLKQFCSPGLNCYACPYAVTACPIGSLQYFVAYGRLHLAPYVIGFLTLLGTIFGRFICGWICPFGLLQDFLYSLKTVKLKLFPPLRHLRWVFLIILVILLPLLSGSHSPAYCKYLCPAGTLEGGVPLGIFSSQIRANIGTLYFIKISILIVFLVGSIAISRFFCRTACPLGLIYGFFNRISILRLDFAADRCLDCGLCEEACPVDLKPQREEFRREGCIRCLQCRDVCPQKCFHFGLKPASSLTPQATARTRRKQEHLS